MECNYQEQHFKQAHCEHHKKQCKKIHSELAEIAVTEAETLCPPARDGRRGDEYGIYEEMYGQIQNKDDEDACYAVDGKEDNKASTEGICAI